MPRKVPFLACLTLVDIVNGRDSAYDDGATKVVRETTRDGAQRVAIVHHGAVVAWARVDEKVLHVSPLSVDLAAAPLTAEAPHLREALTLCVQSLDQLLPYLGKVPADIGLLNSALIAARPLLED